MHPPLGHKERQETRRLQRVFEPHIKADDKRITQMVVRESEILKETENSKSKGEFTGIKGIELKTEATSFSTDGGEKQIHWLLWRLRLF